MKFLYNKSVMKNIFVLILVLIGFFIIFQFHISPKNNIQKKIICDGCNLIIIGIDTLRADRLGYYDYYRELTPTLDNLAKNSYIFKNTITQASWTLPSFMSLFTSTYPYQHKITNKFYINELGEIENSSLDRLSPNIKTLAEILKSNNYKTAGFTGDAGVGKEFGFGKGFDEYYDKDKFGGFNTSFVLAKSWISKNKDNKFFTFIHGYDVHGEFELDYGKRKYSKNYSNTRYNGTMDEEIALREKGLEKGYLNLSEKDLTFWKNLYDDKILNMDKQLSGFIKFLENESLMNKTIIVIVSDHGEEFLEHGKIDHGATLYDELLKVVFMLKLPDSTKKIIKNQVRLIDLMPTILELLGVGADNNLKKQIQGTSLLPLMEGKSLFLDAFSETDYRLFVSKKSIRTSDGWKLIIDYLSGQVELYDLKNDQKETKNLFNSRRDKYRELMKKINFFSNIKLNFTRDNDEDINLKSEKLKNFKLENSFRLNEKEYYNFIKNEEYLKIERTKNIDKKAAEKIINPEITQVIASYSNSLSPYPGEISNEISCPDKFKPTLTKTEIEGNERKFLTTYSNSRFGIGVCSEDLIKYRELIGWIYCPKTKELYKIKYFIPLTKNYTELKKLFINLKCK